MEHVAFVKLLTVTIAKGMHIPIHHYIRPSFTASRLSGRNFSWSSHYSKSLSGYSMVFPAGGATMIDSFEHVD